MTRKARWALIGGLTLVPFVYGALLESAPASPRYIRVSTSAPVPGKKGAHCLKDELRTCAGSKYDSRAGYCVCAFYGQCTLDI